MTRFPTWWPTSGLWRHSDFMNLWAAQAIRAFGSRISRTALPMAALLTIGAEPWQIGVLAALSMAPGVLVGLFLGGLIDRNAKRPLLILCDLLRAALLLTVPLAAWFDLLSMVQLYIVAAGMGALTTLFQIADNTYLPALIGRKSLTEGNARLEATDAIAEIGGPSLAGVLVQLLSAPFALLADAFTYLISAVFLFRIKARESPEQVIERRRGIWSDLRAGIDVCLAEPVVRTLFWVAALEAFFGGFTYGGLYMVFVIDTLVISPATYGTLVALGDIGALVGAFLVMRVARW
ncbi:MAG: hypothetical protein CMM46_09180 [Rhodospirillaceae bacterium]|nr:hypothetical protein [Rhodospirillaceae bacterium]